MSDLEKRVVDFLFDRLTGMENRVEALEKRLHHVEDKVSEILQRGSGERRVVSIARRKANGEQLSPDRDPKRRA